MNDPLVRNRGNRASGNGNKSSIKGNKSASAYYNENDPQSAEFLRNLIAKGLIAPGEVDERSIEDVTPADLAGFVQCHFFAGVGVWSYAARCAGWPDDRPLWTGSCPCQPFSAAGKGAGLADERHLWPAWHHLIRICRPPIVIGEQVASKDGLAWLDLVQSDMEGEAYAFGPLDLCAAGFGAPHIRQRLYLSAYDARPHAGMGHSIGAGLEGHTRHGNGATGRAQPDRPVAEAGGADGPGPVNGFWGAADWLYCTDDKWRPVEPGLEPLVDGASARLVRLRTYGNAICAPQATEFVKAVMEALPDLQMSRRSAWDRAARRELEHDMGNAAPE